MSGRMRQSRTRGMTLVELVISLAVMTLVMGACGSAILLASRALTTGAALGAGAAQSGALALQVSIDLATAVTVTEDGPHAVTFTVADRDGDGNSESIRYWWSGTAGDEVQRQINGAAATVVARNVHRFDLTYLAESFVEE